ncbi:MAG TPA: NgoPII family restriction endonuclease [Candidatus Nanoarchaeia archaeon]|nr:NgoPII family restriction endonuclease [Candidatus Nanoarchaeia archaeon]
MTNNVLRAILNIVAFGDNDLKSYASKSLNRINAVGEQLEFYIKDAIASSFTLPQNKKEEEYSKIFSWLGNQNHPPDIIIKNSDAFEIKKIESLKSSLALNSSPPKDKLLAEDIRITADCKKCDGGNWKEKELFYVIGNAKGSVVNYLFLVHGTCYAAKHEVYEKVHEPIKKEVDSVLDSLGLEKGETVELGKVKRVDPLGITELRIRGMWSIENPINFFKDLCKLEENKFHLFAILRKEKYLSYPKEDIKEIESTKSISVKDVKIKDPNNPAKLVEAKLIAFIIK